MTLVNSWYKLFKRRLLAGEASGKRGGWRWWDGVLTLLPEIHCLVSSVCRAGWYSVDMRSCFFASTPAYPWPSLHYSPYMDSYIISGESFTGLSNPGKTSGGHYACWGLCWILENGSVWVLLYKCGKNATLVAGLADWWSLSSLLFSRLSTTFSVEVAQNRNSVGKVMLI